MTSRTRSAIAASPRHRAAADANVGAGDRDAVHVDATGNLSMPQGERAGCPVCGASAVTLHSAPQFYHEDLREDDLRITDSRYGITLPLLRCTSCEFLFADSQQVSRIPQLYAAVHDAEYSASQDSRKLQMQWLLELVQRYAPKAKTLLDVGAGSGLLVREAAKFGLHAVGVEPSEWLVKEALSSGTTLICGMLPTPALTGNHFDIVAAVDVIEHVPQPAQFLSDCMQQLEENGALLLVTPDVGSLAARLLGPRWWHYRIAHIGYFKKKSLMRLFSNAGVEPLCWARAKWFFRVRYIAERLERYLPGVRAVNRVAPRFAPSRWLYDRVVCLKLRDSYVVILKRKRTGYGR